MLSDLIISIISCCEASALERDKARAESMSSASSLLTNSLSSSSLSLLVEATSVSSSLVCWLRPDMKRMLVSGLDTIFFFICFIPTLSPTNSLLSIISSEFLLMSSTTFSSLA